MYPLVKTINGIEINQTVEIVLLDFVLCALVYFFFIIYNSNNTLGLPYQT